MTMLRCAGMLNLTHPAHRLCLLPDYSWAKQGRVTRVASPEVVIPGRATRTRVYPSSAIWLSKSAKADLVGEPGISQLSSPDSGFEALPRPGMTTGDTDSTNLKALPCPK